MSNCFRGSAHFLRYTGDGTGHSAIFRVVLRAALERRRTYFQNNGRELLEDVLAHLTIAAVRPPLQPPRIQDSPSRGKEIVFQVVSQSFNGDQIFAEIAGPLERDWAPRTKVLSLYNSCRTRLDKDPVFAMNAAVQYALQHGADALCLPLGVMQNCPVPRFRKTGVVVVAKGVP